MDSTSLEAALMISEKAISSASLLAEWTGVILGAFSILVTIGIVYVSVKYIRDARTLTATIQREVALATMGFRQILDEKIAEERKQAAAQIEAIKNEISLVWLRNVVTSKDKDPHAIGKAIDLAIETKNADYALSMISELNDFARNNPFAVGGYYWKAMKFEEKLSAAKTIPGISQQSLELIEAYRKDIEEMDIKNPHRAPNRK